METQNTEAHGVVYTQRWAVDLVLDLAGYDPSANLVDAVAIEPAAGTGNFLVAMVSRLITACRRQGRQIGDCASSLLAYELDPVTAEEAHRTVVQTLIEHMLAPEQAEELARKWIRGGDFLLESQSNHLADFVLGNPPYVRLEHLGASTERFYRQQYPTMVGRTNLYIAFFEAALRTLKPSGVCAFICADRWMLNQQGSQLRRMITSNFSVETVVEMHRADAFESRVSAYPAVTVLRRADQGPAVVATIDEGVNLDEVPDIVRALEAVRMGDNTTSPPEELHAFRSEHWFQGTEPWTRTTPERTALLRSLEEQFHPLVSDSTGTKIGIGVATGADDIFISTDSELVESCRLLPLAMTRDTASGRLSWSGHFLVNPWNERGLVELSKYPRLRSYFERHERHLRSRHVGKANPQAWYRTIDRVRHDLTHEVKLYIPDIKDRLNPVLDEGSTYPHHNLYFLQSDCWDLEVLGGLLLSDVAKFFIESYGTRIRGGYLRFQAQYLTRIRVPRPGDLPASQARLLAEAFRCRDRDLATRTALDLYRIERIPGVGR